MDTIYDLPVGGAPGGGARYRSESLPTEKQLGLIAKLAAEKGQEVPEVESRRDASRAIDQLMKLATPAPTGPRRNRRAGPCARCQGEVAEGQGLLERDDDRWIVTHEGACAPVMVVPVVPDGYYAVLAEAGHTSFYKVTAGRKPGVVFLDLCLGGGGNGSLTRTSVPYRNRPAILAKIAEDPVAAALRFRQEAGFCARCGRGLTNKTSLDQAMGPECRRK